MKDDSTSRESVSSLEPFGITDLEDALRGPDGEAVRDHVLARLEDVRSSVDAALAQGVARSRFEAMQTVSIALRTACGLLRQVES